MLILARRVAFVEPDAAGKMVLTMDAYRYLVGLSSGTSVTNTNLATATGTLGMDQVAWVVRNLSASDTAVCGDFCDVDATSGAKVITMPTAVGNSGKSIAVRKNDASGNTVTVDGDAAETINGAATQVIAARYTTIVMVSNGTEWCIA